MTIPVRHKGASTVQCRAAPASTEPIARSTVQRKESLRSMGYADQMAALDPDAQVQAKPSSAAPVQMFGFGDFVDLFSPLGAMKSKLEKEKRAADAAKKPPEEGVPAIIDQVEGVLSLMHDTIERGREAGVDLDRLPPALRKVRTGLKTIKRLEDANNVLDSVSDWYQASSDWDAFLADPQDSTARYKAAHSMGEFISGIGKLGSLLPPPADAIFKVLTVFDGDWFVSVSSKLDPSQRYRGTNMCEEARRTGDLEEFCGT